MRNGNIHEEDFLSMTERMREAYTFRLLMEIREEVKKMTTLRLGCSSAAAFVGGVVGGVAAILRSAKFKIFG